MLLLSGPNMAGNEWKYVKDCLDTGWVSSVGAYVDQFEKMSAEFAGSKYAVATSSGTTGHDVQRAGGLGGTRQGPGRHRHHLARQEHQLPGVRVPEENHLERYGQRKGCCELQLPVVAWGAHKGGAAPRVCHGRRERLSPATRPTQP